MLQMGKMCHCKATLWKIDPANGEIQWQADRGANTNGLGAYDDGSNIYLYETGAAAPDGFLATKRRDDVDRQTKIWSTAPSGIGNNPAEFSSFDQVLWMGNLGRLADADGSTINSAAVADNPHYMYPGDSGEMFAANMGSAHYPSGTTLKRVSTAVAAVVSLSSLWPGKCYMTPGWFVGVNASPRLIRNYDNALSLSSSANAPLASGTNQLWPAQRVSTDGKVFCVETNSAASAASKWQRIDAAGLTSDWSIAAPETDVDAVGLTADSDVYVLGTTSATTGHIYRLSGVDGSTTWSTAVGATNSGVAGWSYYLIREGSLLLVVLAAGASVMITNGGFPVVAMALKASDGTIVWARGMETDSIRFIGQPYVIDGYLYAAGARGRRAKVPNLVHL